MACLAGYSSERSSAARSQQLEPKLGHSTLSPPYPTFVLGLKSDFLRQ
jgi:hypothetical protein